MSDSNGDDAAVRTLARLIVREMLADRQVEQLIREVTLRVLTEQTVIEKASAARGFLAACSARGVRVRLAGDGKLRVRGELGSDLRAALMSCHDDVITHLKREREIIALTDARIKADDERQAKEDAKLYEEWRRCGGGDVPA